MENLLQPETKPETVEEEVQRNLAIQALDPYGFCGGNRG